MEKIIHSYETVYIIKPSLTEDENKAVIAKFSDLVAANGTLESVDEWGKRKLAYLINDFSEGYYVLMTFKSDAEFPTELERVFRISDDIIRSLVIRKDV